MTNTIIIDTGFFLALANKKDEFHQSAKKLFQSLVNENEFITTWCVATETCYFLQDKVSIDAPRSFINKIATGKLIVFELKPHHCPRIEELRQKYLDLPMDLADASLVILAEELGHGNILSVDFRDFNTYRWKNKKPFTNLFIKME